MQYFYNEQPFENSSLELENNENQFPIIKDFTIRIMESDFSGMQMLYYSEENGVVTSFPWLTDVDQTLKTMNMMQIFLGSKERPYCVENNGTKVVIYTDGEFVYVLQGDSSSEQGYGTYFRVKYDTYISEWETLLTYFKSKLFEREEAFEMFGVEDIY
ncbi:MAG: hypothetical protein Q4F05_12560 [bacterium]|nr:hypothetical protein [bacterium]